MDFFSFVFNTAGRLFTYSDFQWPDASVATKQCFFFFFLEVQATVLVHTSLIQATGLAYQSPGSDRNSWAVDWDSFSHLDQGSSRLDP